MTETSNVLDTAPVDLDAEPKCECVGFDGEPDEACPNTATWVGKPKCGHTDLQCDFHKAIYDSRMFVFICGDCDQKSYHVDWTHL